MIVNAFKTSTSEKVSQKKLASYSKGFEAVEFTALDTYEPKEEEYRAHWSEAKTTDLREEYNALNNNPDAWKALMKQCRTKLWSCDQTGVPMLKELNFESTDPGTALSWCDIEEQVKKGRPVLFGYQEINNSDMSGTHFLVVLGAQLNLGKPEVQIWDPWPALSGRDFDKKEHLRWIPYADFANPGSDWGVGADHQRDRFNIRNKTGSWKSEVGLLPGACDIPQQTVQDVVLMLEDMESVQRLFGPNNILQTLHGEAMPAPGQSWGAPFPIIGLTKAAIVSNGGSADRLIRSQVSTVLVPVLESDKIVDVFVASNDRNGQRWRKRGYASVGITRRLVEARTEFVQRTGTREDAFYLLSIPYRRTFFVGQGLGNDARLMPIATDAKLGVRRGKVVAASALLGCIAGEATHRDISAPPHVCQAH